MPHATHAASWALISIFTSSLRLLVLWLMRECLCLSRLLMSTWPPTCSAQSKRWRRPTSDECPSCLFMEWLSRHQRWSAVAHSVFKLQPPLLIICLEMSEPSWDDWKFLSTVSLCNDYVTACILRKWSDLYIGDQYIILMLTVRMSL